MLSARVFFGGWIGRLDIENILLKYSDEIWKLPLGLSTYIMEGRVKILETDQNLEKL